VFAVAAAAALARIDGTDRLLFAPGFNSGAARFAHAIGIEEAIRGDGFREPRERDRTVTLTRVRGRGPWEATAEKIVNLMLPAHPRPPAADLFYHVLVELLRNVGQHSNDPAGGIVAAQVNAAGPYQGAPALQVVVADNGIGVFEALRHMRPTITTPGEALVRALEPHVSGTFPEGETGSQENAGMGLFVISELAKETDGRLLLASRGASYFLDRATDPHTQPVITNGNAPDYPGTLVVFETTLSHVGNFGGIMEHIRTLAAERTPKRITQHWLRFADPPSDVKRLLVGVASEDTAAALHYAQTVLQPLVLRRESFALESDAEVSLEASFLHSLLHETIRMAWALKVPIHVVGASPAVRAQLELVENYSLGG
jgi:hypothetical protein